jgi:AraC-like DNA-binding protein
MIAELTPVQQKTPFRHVQVLADESFHVLEIRGAVYTCTWHFHPELQLGLVIRGGGERVVGDSVAPIRAGEVVLLGSNLPHVWKFRGGTRGDAIHAIVVHFSTNCLGGEFLEKPEMRDIRQLFARAQHGLEAHGATQRRAAAILRGMRGRDGFARVMDLLSLLALLADSAELTQLCSSVYRPLAAESERLRRVCEYIDGHHAEALDRDTLARVAHLTPSAFSRFFRVQTGKTVREYVTEVRVGHACRLLMEADANMTEIALRSGFADATTFDRSFRRIKNMSPSQFRQRVKGATRDRM